MNVAERTREAVRRRPFLHDALGAGVVNYAAAAEYLDVDRGDDAVTAALRRYADDLDPATDPGDARVTMQRGLSRVGDADEAGDEPSDGSHEPLLTVAGTGYRTDRGDLAAVVARGAVEPLGLERALGRLRTADVDVEAAAVADGTVVVVVGGRETAAALREVEGALE